MKNISNEEIELIDRLLDNTDIDEIYKTSIRFNLMLRQRDTGMTSMEMHNCIALSYLCRKKFNDDLLAKSSLDLKKRLDRENIDKTKNLL
jgi:hypothetical protein